MCYHFYKVHWQLDVDAFIHRNDFKMHHFTLFSGNHGGNRKVTVFELFLISTKIKDFKQFEEYLLSKTTY